jgi:hypothetical protein
MTDYTPLFTPSDSHTSTASAPVTGGGVLYASGSSTVANTGASSNLPIGVAAHDAGTGESVGIYGRGTIHRLTASGAITAGNPVEAATLGKVAAHTPGTNDVRVFGIALTTVADAASVEVMEI